MQAMRREWLESADATNASHWKYVVEPLPEQLPNKKRDRGHEGWTLDTFCQLPEAIGAKLHVCEVIALRIYTGIFASCLSVVVVDRT
jgi:hypothetical protein